MAKRARLVSLVTSSTRRFTGVHPRSSSHAVKPYIALGFIRTTGSPAGARDRDVHGRQRVVLLLNELESARYFDPPPGCAGCAGTSSKLTNAAGSARAGG